MSNETQLTLPERAAVALGAPKYEQEIRELVAKTVTITEVKNKDGREQCHGAMMTLKGTRVAIEKAAKAAREDATAFSKAVIAEEKRLVALAEPEEARLQALRDAWDAEAEREKKAKAAAEKARVDGIRKRIAEMQAIPAMVIGKSSEVIASILRDAETAEVTLADFQEFADEAEMVKAAAVLKLSSMLAAQQAQETEQARLAAEREALERQRAELAEQERQAAATRAEQARKDREAREREEARLREIREEQEATRRAAQAAAEEAMRRQQAEHERRMAAERVELARQQAEIAAAKAEQERIEREAREAAEAAAKFEADHAEALAENARIDAERKAAAEAARIRDELQAAEAERLRRERVNFELNGPDARDMLEVLAAHYQVEQQTVLSWINRWIWAEVEITA